MGNCLKSHGMSLPELWRGQNSSCCAQEGKTRTTLLPLLPSQARGCAARAALQGEGKRLPAELSTEPSQSFPWLGRWGAAAESWI